MIQKYNSHSLDILQLDFWSETDVMVGPDRLDFVLNVLDKVGMDYDVKIQNVQE